ncbi:MAG: hypothetical protein R3D29_10090 [Nitratireductor sp.]
MKPKSVFASLPALGAILGLSLPLVAFAGSSALAQTVFTQRQIIVQLQQPPRGNPRIIKRRAPSRSRAAAWSCGEHRNRRVAGCR